MAGGYMQPPSGVQSVTDALSTARRDIADIRSAPGILGSGPKAAAYGSVITVSTPAGLGSSAWVAGAQATATSWTGRWLVVISIAEAEATACAVRMSLAASGAAAESFGAREPLVLSHRSNLDTTWGAPTLTALVEGNPGEATFTAGFRAIGTQNAYGGSVDVRGHTMVVTPL